MLKAGAPQHLQRAALLRAGLVEENDPHASGRQQRTGTHADHHRTASTDAATVMTSTQNARNATPENPELRDNRQVTQVNGTNELMTQIHDG